MLSKLIPELALAGLMRSAVTPVLSEIRLTANAIAEAVVPLTNDRVWTPRIAADFQRNALGHGAGAELKIGELGAADDVDVDRHGRVACRDWPGRSTAN